MTLQENEVHIYHHSIDTPSGGISNFEKLLSEDELKRANRFRFEKDRNHFITGRGLLRIILSRYLDVSPAGINFSYQEKGKPYLKNNSLKFNLAHSGGKAVYALTMNNEVGVDLEVMKDLPDALDIASRFFSESEVQEFQSVSEENVKTAFYNCWTRKEAFIKAIGEGLSHPLSDFSVTLKPGDEPKFLWMKNRPDEIYEWSLINIDADDNFVSSLAMKASDIRIVYKELNQEVI
ncbi:MAG: 4'-phosphopantetheinyl transferase superfamily protein [Ignavibacteria bacterium]|nr:4'-phosphopantetheinyl transferase superfamily protein [Ignavibacteria bacterium]